MSLSVVTPPTSLPVSLAELKTYLRVSESFADDNAELMGLLRAATDIASERTDRALINTTFDEFLDAFPDSSRMPIYPERGKLQSVTTLKYIDTAGVLQTWDSANYTVDANHARGRIYTAYNVTWPTTRSVPNAVEIRYVAGYGTDWNSVPEALRKALMDLVEHWYGHRGAVMNTTVLTDIPLNAERIIQHYALRGLIA